jgi:hypothetical protein
MKLGTVFRRGIELLHQVSCWVSCWKYGPPNTRLSKEGKKNRRNSRAKIVTDSEQRTFPEKGDALSTPPHFRTEQHAFRFICHACVLLILSFLKTLKVPAKCGGVRAGREWIDRRLQRYSSAVK